MGTPQGSAISPLLANLFMHYAFDAWMARTYPAVTFERYCDDAVVHCRSKAQAEYIRDKIAARLAECGLELHPVIDLRFLDGRGSQPSGQNLANTPAYR